MDANMKVLLYADGSQPAFSAAVYAATILKNSTNMVLTVVQLQESDGGTAGLSYNWRDTWPVNPNSAWMQKIIRVANSETKKQYQDILEKTNEIFFQRGFDVRHEVLFANANIPDMTDALIDYAKKNSFKLIILGTRGLSDLQGLIFGSFAYTMLHKSPIPVLLVKKLPQSFIDGYQSEDK